MKRQEADEAIGHTVRAYELLRAGDFRRGWAEFEWRWKTPLMQLPSYAQPRWRGLATPIKGKTILLLHEQGFGDTIQMIRYAGLLADRGATVIAAVPKALERLMRRTSGVADVVVTQPPPRPFDMWTSMMSLPVAFNTASVKMIPCNVPYISVSPSLTAHWNGQIRAGDQVVSAPPPLRVGLCWAGRPTHKQDASRSIPAPHLAPLCELGGMRVAAKADVLFCSLQTGEAAAAGLAQFPPSVRPIDLGSRFDDFADTAAAIANLDLVITVDTAVAHLAGALGKPVWTLLAQEADWRWLTNREDSPWYPTMRLFRQSRPGDWSGVIARVVEELRQVQVDR